MTPPLVRPQQRALLALTLLFAGGLLASASPAAQAEPYLAQREGYRCSKCHVNGTGGGKRTDFGAQYAVTHLTIAGSDPTDAAAEADTSPIPWLRLDPHLSDSISVGANFRLNHRTVLAEEVHNTFGNSEANVYLQFDVTPAITLYTDVSYAEGAVEAREVLAIWRIGGLYFKGGLLLPPFGLRIWGDDEFTRQVTGYNYASPDLGVEVGYGVGPFGVTLAVGNGAGGGLDFDNAKQVSLVAEVAWRPIRFGVSGSYNSADDRSTALVGGFLGSSFGRFTLLAEADLQIQTFDDEDETVYALVVYAEADVLLLRGLNLKVSYGFHDPAMDVEENARMTFRAGLEIFPVPYIAATAFYELRESVPQDEVGNADVIQAELHLFF